MDQKAGKFNRPPARSLDNEVGFWRPLLALAALSGLLVFQAWAYTSRLSLSLGPRVILQPWLLRHGSILYEDIVDMHSPLMGMILAALLPLFPDGFQLAKLVLVALISITTLLVFVTGWRKTGWLGGLWAACFFVVWSPAMGFGKLWYETFLAPIFLFWLFIFEAPGLSSTPGQERRLRGDPSQIAAYSVYTAIILGILGGVSVLIKQQAALVFLAFVFWRAFALWHSKRPAAAILREILLLGLGAVIPVSIYLGYQVAVAGTLGGFLYWVIGYPFDGVYRSIAGDAPTTIQVRKIASACLLVPAAIFCLVVMRRKGDHHWLTFGLGLLILATGSFSAYPRFEFFHLQAILPVLAVVSAMTLAQGLRTPVSGRYFALLGVAAALSAFWLITEGSNYRAALVRTQPPRVYEYSDLLPLAQEIQRTVGPDGCVYIFPDNEAVANLYTILGCPPPKFWVFHYPWYMLDWVRAKIMRTLEADPPEWVVYLPGQWEAEQRNPEEMRYLQEHYSQVAVFQSEQGGVRILRRSDGRR